MWLCSTGEEGEVGEVGMGNGPSNHLLGGRSHYERDQKEGRERLLVLLPVDESCALCGGEGGGKRGLMMMCGGLKWRSVHSDRATKAKDHRGSASRHILHS